MDNGRGVGVGVASICGETTGRNGHYSCYILLGLGFGALLALPRGPRGP